MADLPLATVERIMKKAGAKRVSDSAKRRMCEVLEVHAIEITGKAYQLAKHAKRKTVTAEDISLVVKQIKK